MKNKIALFTMFALVCGMFSFALPINADEGNTPRLYIDLTDDAITTVTTQPEIENGTSTDVYFGLIIGQNGLNEGELVAGDTTVFTFPDGWSAENCAASTTDADDDSTVDGAFDAVADEVATYTYTATTTLASTTGLQFCLTVTSDADENGVVKVVTREFEGAKAFIYSGDMNDVVVSATVYNTLNFVIRNAADDAFTNACDLGVLNTANVNECSYRLGVSADGYNGFDVFIDDTGATTGLALSDGTAIAPIATGTPVVAGTESYGFALTNALGLTESVGYTLNDIPVPAAQAKILELGGAIVSNAGYNYTVGDLTTSSLVTHRASIGDLTATGNYEQTVSYYVTARY